MLHPFTSLSASLVSKVHRISKHLEAVLTHCLNSLHTIHERRQPLIVGKHKWIVANGFPEMPNVAKCPSKGLVSLSSKVTTIKTVKQMDELVDTGTDTPVWQRYRLKIMSLSQQVSEVRGDLFV